MAKSAKHWPLIGVLCFLSHDGIWMSEAAYETNETCHHLQKRSLFRIDKKVCYDHLGCFSSGPPFYHPIYRPISLPPQHPDLIDTTFQLYTRRNRDRPIFLSPFKPRSLKKSSHHQNALWRVIITGLNDNLYFTSWVKRLKEAFLKRADDNVLVVDWSGSNRLPYSLAVANARVVGAQIAYFINFIHKTEGISAESFHLLGHSLGAHIAGYAGERLENLGRITGLDPAGPWFRHVPENVRLDPSDAIFVDVIHSNPAPTLLQGYGTPEDGGHLDFYPGGGNPPGCKEAIVRSIFQEQPSEAVSKLVACQHLIAYEYFIQSFNQNGCLFVGVQCQSWGHFLSGHCDCGDDGGKCALMGIFSPTFALPPSGLHVGDRQFYLKVQPREPYCVHQYRITLHLHYLAKKTYGFQSGLLDMKIVGSLEVLHSQLRIDLNLMESSQKTKLLLSANRHIGDVQSASAIFHSDPVIDVHALHHVESDAILDKMEVNYLFPLLKKYTSFFLCRTSEVPTDRGKGFHLSVQACH